MKSWELRYGSWWMKQNLHDKEKVETQINERSSTKIIGLLSSVYTQYDQVIYRDIILSILVIIFWETRSNLPSITSVAKRFRLLSMDRISSLPDPILCHILSSLPIRFSVRTSVLSRRWRFLWTYISDLYFDYLENYDSESENRMGFSDMVYWVLLLHNGSINSLVIHSRSDTSQRQVDAWIRTAIARNVQVLCLSGYSDVRFPQFCFTYKTLVELTISECLISAEPHAVSLPRLKKLHLWSNCFENDESLPNLLSGCSAIEGLRMSSSMVDCDVMTCCYVRSPTLKSLDLHFEFLCRSLDHEHKLVLDIPAVQYLRIYDNFSQIIRTEKLSSLVVANVCFYNKLEPNIIRSRDTFQFVEKLSNAKSLTFASTATMKLLDPPFSIATTRFHNLTKLEVASDWRFLAELLQSAYKLESLTIRDVFPPLREKVKDEPNLNCWREPKHIPKCLLSSLKYVSISGFVGQEQEYLDMIRYILGHAKLLKMTKMKSVFRGNDDTYSKLSMFQQILSFPRGSQECQIAFD